MIDLLEIRGRHSIHGFFIELIALMQNETGSISSTSTAAGSDPGELSFVQQILDIEARAVGRIFDEIKEDATAAIDILDQCTGHVVTTGMGKSGIIAQKISATLSSIGIPSHFLHPAEAVHGDLGRIKREDVLWAFSYSGNTEEVVILSTLVKQDNVPVIGTSANRESQLARVSDVHLCIGNITEACPLNLAPTTSTTATLALGDAISMAASRRKNFSAEDFQKRHPGGMLGVGLRPVTEILRFEVGKNLPLIPETMAVGEALKVADTGRRPGAMVIVNDKGLMSGIFTDGDLRRLIMDEGDAGLLQPIANVMTRQPRHLTTSHLLRDTVQLVREHRQDEIPVVDQNGHPVGLVDVQDLIAMKIIKE